MQQAGNTIGVSNIRVSVDREQGQRSYAAAYYCQSANRASYYVLTNAHVGHLSASFSRTKSNGRKHRPPRSSSRSLASVQGLPPPASNSLPVGARTRSLSQRRSSSLQARFRPRSFSSSRVSFPVVLVRTSIEFGRRHWKRFYIAEPRNRDARGPSWCRRAIPRARVCRGAMAAPAGHRDVWCVHAVCHLWNLG